MATRTDSVNDVLTNSGILDVETLLKEKERLANEKAEAEEANKKLRQRLEQLQASESPSEGSSRRFSGKTNHEKSVLRYVNIRSKRYTHVRVRGGKRSCAEL